MLKLDESTRYSYLNSTKVVGPQGYTTKVITQNNFDGADVTYSIYIPCAFVIFVTRSTISLVLLMTHIAEEIISVLLY